MQHGNLTLLATTQISAGIYNMALNKMYQEASYGILDGDELALSSSLLFSLPLLDEKVDIPFIK